MGLYIVNERITATVYLREQFSLNKGIEKDVITRVHIQTLLKSECIKASQRRYCKNHIIKILLFGKILPHKELKYIGILIAAVFHSPFKFHGFGCKMRNAVV